MAILLSITDGGNMMNASTWGVVQPTSFQGTPTTSLSSGLLSTTQFQGTAFTLVSAVTLSGIAVQLSGRSASPSGTLNIQLYNLTSATIVGQVTVNVADLPNSNGIGNFHIDWVYFKFPSTITTVAGNSYSIRFQSSVASQISFYYTTNTSNINRALVTTTTQAPITGDSLIIAGQYTAPGVNATTTVIMNDNGTIQTSTIWVSTKGIFKYLTTAPYNIMLFAAGHIVIGVGGTFNIGTITEPITQPTTNQTILLMVCTTALQYSIFVYGTFTTHGETRTIASKLLGDVVPTQTTCTTATLTDWKSGDNILVPSTTRTYTQYEVINLTGTTGTTLSLGGFVNAHGGDVTTKVQADMVNLTRNILIFSNLNTARSNIQVFTNAVVSCYYTIFSDMGTGVTIANSGICVNALTSGIGSFNFQGNVVTMSQQSSTTSANSGMFTTNGTGTTISNNIFCFLGWTTISPTLTIHTLNDNNYIIANLNNGVNIACQIMGSNNVMSSNSGWNSVANFFNNATNNSFYSNASYGLYLNMTGLTTIGNIPVNTGMNNFKIWRNNTNGILQNSSGGGINKTSIMSFDNIYVFGNTSTNINNGGRTWNKLLFTNSYFYGGGTLVAPNTIAFGNPNIHQDAIYFNNCYFGYSDSNLTPSPHSISNIQVATGHSINFNNCYFYGTEATWNGGNAGVSNANIQTSHISTNHNGVTGSNKYWYSSGTILTDTTIYNTSSPSLRLMPAGFFTIFKLPTTTTKVPVKAGQTCSVSVNVRKSITTDGLIYNGTAPRLMYCFNPIMGNMIETIGASYSSPTNLLQFPQNYEQSIWGKINATVSLGATAAPDGTVTATQITNTTNTLFRLNQTITATTPTIGTVYTYSSYIKQGSGRYVQVLISDVGELYGTVIQYDFTLNTIIQNGVLHWTATNLSCVSVGNGWFRMSVTLTSASALNTSLKISGPGCAFGGGGTTTTGEYVYIWGSKLELGSTLTPYVTDGGVWQTLSYTTPPVTNDGIIEFYVDCDGSTGWINVDDWSTTTYNDSRGTNYWGNSSVYIEADYKVPGASYTFFN